MMKDQLRENSQAQETSPNPNTPKKNCFVVLCSRGHQDDCPNVNTDMSQVVSIILYALLDLGATLFTVTPFIGMTFDVLADVFIKPFRYYPGGLLCCFLKSL